MMFWRFLEWLGLVVIYRERNVFIECRTQLTPRQISQLRHAWISGLPDDHPYKVKR